MERHGLWPCHGLIALFAFATMGFDVINGVAVANQTVAQAAYEHLYYAGVKPLGTLFLLISFLALAATGNAVARKKNTTVAMWILVSGSLLRAGCTSWASMGRSMHSRRISGRPLPCQWACFPFRVSSYCRFAELLGS